MPSPFQGGRGLSLASAVVGEAPAHRLPGRRVSAHCRSPRRPSTSSATLSRRQRLRRAGGCAASSQPSWECQRLTVPNSDNAIVEGEKLIGYLLSSEHPVGRHKAVVFRRCGYELEACERLVDDLKSLLSTGELVSKVESPYGIKYVVDGSLPCTDGGEIDVRTVWILEPKTSAPRFVTAYPR